MAALGDIVEAINDDLAAKYAAREVALGASRRTIRLSANAIRAMHRSERERGGALLDEARAQLAEASQALAEHPDVLHAGFVHDAAKELAEAGVTMALLFDGEIPTPDELGVAGAAYLNGVAEAVGELRRRLLTALRGGDLDRADATFDAMEAILETLETVDYPDAMTGNLRRSTDVARSLVERSRADLTTTTVQERLRARLEDAAR